MPFLIAIDGPAGAGKSTVARRVAKALGYTYLDTGAMYRSVAWKAMQKGVDLENVPVLEALARELTIEFSPLQPDDSQSVRVDGEDVTAAIRTPEVSSLTSRISVVPEVRTIVVGKQRSIAAGEEHGAVLEGRDIGTVVFPQAQLKVFLTASPRERTRRRVEELRSQGYIVDPEQTFEEMLERDLRDSQRTTSPLAIAPDAVPLDTDGITVEQVVDRILALWQERRP